MRAVRKLEPNAEVYQQACPLWVPLVEEGWVDDPITNLVVYRYVRALSPHPIDTVILGCTHYPALRSAIQKVLGPAITLVDSSLGLTEDLEALNICGHSNAAAPGHVRILCTDFSPRLEETLGFMLGKVIHDAIETVNINK